MPDEQLPEHTAEEGDRIDLQQILVPIWENRKRIVTVSFAIAVVTYIINLLVPTYYRSTTTLLPETEKSKLSALGQFADVAQIAGVSIPGSEIARLYPSIILSETVLRSVIVRKYNTHRFAKNQVDLIEYFELEEETLEENMYKALGRLEGLLSTSYENKVGIVTVSLEMREPQVAADVLNAVIEELDNFMRQKKISTASEQLKWIDVRIKDVQKDLRKSEETLKDFREKNRRVIDSPQLLLEEGRLIREVEMNSAIFVELKKQYELAKIEEIKNTTVVNVLDPARAPVKKSRPKRMINALIFAIVGFVGISVFYVVSSIFGEQIRMAFEDMKRRR
jgi:tyrosine-protein kinase Etk/Wzc